MVAMILETVIQYRSSSLEVSKTIVIFKLTYCPHEVTDQPQSTGVAPVSLLSTAAATDLLPTPVLTTPTNTSLLEPSHIAILTGLNTHHMLMLTTDCVLIIPPH